MVHEQFTRLLWVALWHLHTQILCHFAKTSMNNIMLIHCKLIMIREGSGVGGGYGTIETSRWL